MRGGLSLASLNPFKKNEKGEGGWLSGLNPFGKKPAPVTAGNSESEPFNPDITASEGETTVSRLHQAQMKHLHQMKLQHHQ